METRQTIFDNPAHLLHKAFLYQWLCEYAPPNQDPVPVWITTISIVDDAVQEIEIQSQQFPEKSIRLNGSEVDQVRVVVEADRTLRLEE